MFPFDKTHNELVFENKNKMYGAYVIRREYDYALKISVLVATAFIGLIVTAGIIANNTNTTIKKVIEELPGAEVIFYPPPIEKPIEEITKPKIKQHVVSPTKPTTGEWVASDNKEDKHEQKQVTGPVNPDLPVGDTDSTDSDENTTVFTVAKSVAPGPVSLIASEMPDIEGGVLAYLSRHIRYPEDARESNVQGTVFVSFVVEKDGSISNVDVLNKQKVGYGCEEEAIRVIKSGKWKPGKNNGQAVRVQLTLPVKYQLK